MAMKIGPDLKAAALALALASKALAM